MNLILKTNVLIAGKHFHAGSVVEMDADQATDMVARGLADYQGGPTDKPEDESVAKPAVKRRMTKKVME